MDPDFRQRFQYRSVPKALAVHFSGISAYALFRVAMFLPLLLIFDQIVNGWGPQRLWWLLASPAAWVLGHLLWCLSDFIYFRVNRSEARRDERGFFLLLRPFKTSAATAVPGAPETPDLIGHLLRGTHSLIWQYGVALAPLGRLVTVGKVRLPKPVLSNDTVCALAADHNWMELVRELAQRCRAIILLFDEGSGIMDEIKHLSEQGLTQKTIIRVAPIQMMVSDPHASQRRWNEARKLMLQIGLNPPEAPPDGFLYIPQPDFSILHRAELRDGTERAIRKLVAKIPTAETACSLREAMLLIEDFEARTFGKPRPSDP